jgi:hypothetical protein
LKGAFLISLESELFDDSAHALYLSNPKAIVGKGADTVQLADPSGRLFTMYRDVPDGAMSEITDGPFTLGSGQSVPEMGSVFACPVECRWEDLFTALV